MLFVLFVDMEHDFHFANHVVCIFIDKLLENMANREISSKDVQCVELWSDEPTCHFKNRHMAGEYKILVY